jgi:acetyltransferase
MTVINVDRLLFDEAPPCCPAGWDREVELGGSRFRIRPIRPMDAGLYPYFLQMVSEDDLRFRYLSTAKPFSPERIFQLTHIDFERDVAFVATDLGTGQLAGVARYTGAPEQRGAEFGILVRSDLHGIDLGRKLLLQLMYYAKASGIRRIYGFVRRDNVPMLSLATSLGFVSRTHRLDLTLVDVEKDLTGLAAAAVSGRTLSDRVPGGQP